MKPSLETKISSHDQARCPVCHRNLSLIKQGSSELNLCNKQGSNWIVSVFVSYYWQQSNNIFSSHCVKLENIYLAVYKVFTYLRSRGRVLELPFSGIKWNEELTNGQKYLRCEIHGNAKRSNQVVWYAFLRYKRSPKALSCTFYCKPGSLSTTLDQILIHLISELIVSHFYLNFCPSDSSFAIFYFLWVYYLYEVLQFLLFIVFQSCFTIFQIDFMSKLPMNIYVCILSYKKAL